MEKFLISIIIFALTLSSCTIFPQARTTASDSPVPDSPQPALTLLPAESPPPNVGAAVAYSRVLDGATLDFEFKDGSIFDLQTGSLP